MTSVSTPYRGDARGMARGRQPVMHRGPDSAPFERRIALALMAGYQQQDAVARRNRPFQRPVDRLPGPIQAVAMEIEDPVGLHPA